MPFVVFFFCKNIKLRFSKTNQIYNFLIALFRPIGIKQISACFFAVRAGVTIVGEVDKFNYIILLMGFTNTENVYIENAFILDGDQIIYNPEILAPEFERSGYNSVWTDDETDEWLQTVENGIVTACSRTGGKGGWQLYSISRWTAEDGKKLKRHLEIEFEQKKNRQIYWDDVAMFCYPEEYQLGIRPMNKDDIIEVDNLSELIALDASYKKYVEEK